MPDRQLLFSVTRKDLRIDTFKAGGPGGQNQNKRETGVRITHLASGAVGIARENRTQEQNMAAAFGRMAQSATFRAWHKVETARRMGRAVDIETEVDRMMRPENLTVEFRVQGKWQRQDN